MMEFNQSKIGNWGVVGNFISPENGRPLTTYEPVIGGTSSDPFGVPGGIRYVVILHFWPGRPHQGTDGWTWYRDTIQEAHQLASHFARLAISGHADIDGAVGSSVGPKHLFHKTGVHHPDSRW